ncbi:ATP-binding protein [uncultured Marixanthomonas sp.]|uniref:sensor histidine kinase n=1 Tax=uncultured Marixanthomonas sp. TaxID=757245 RepID=UPI0030DCEE10|tara:strand:+ start:17797 stop:18570 length:774 start_codon:yes stop_codon:yes gene_type:complete
MDQKEIAGLVSVLILLLLVAVIITLFTVFVRRKNKLLEEQERTKKAFEKELSETQIEIREETLRNISWELHDNIGQLMTLAKIQAQMAKTRPETLDEVADTIGKGIHELRTLSKLINPEALKSLDLVEALSMEIERFNRLEFIKSYILVSGKQYEIDSEKEVIIFRILQEFFSNTIKHSKASNLNVEVDYKADQLVISAQDNGVGFASDADFSGIGMKNMKNRAKVIGAELNITSEKDKGTALKLNYKYNSDKLDGF